MYVYISCLRCVRSVGCVWSFPFQVHQLHLGACKPGSESDLTTYALPAAIPQVEQCHTYMHACMHTYIQACIRTCVSTCIHTHIHTHITYIRACTHTHIHTNKQANTQTNTHTYTHIHTYRHTHIHIYAYIHTYMLHTYMYICIHTHIHIYIYTHIFAYIHAYMHTYLNTYIHACIHAYIGLFLNLDYRLINYRLGLACSRSRQPIRNRMKISTSAVMRVSNSRQPGRKASPDLTQTGPARSWLQIRICFREFPIHDCSGRRPDYRSKLERCLKE